MRTHTRIALIIAMGALSTSATGQDLICQTTLEEIASFPTPGEAQHAQVVGSTMYIADGNRGLRIVDVSDPTNPAFLGHAPTGASSGAHTTDVHVVNNIAFVTDAFGGLRLFDVLVPASPLLLGKTDVLEGPRGVEVHWPYAYVADASGGLKILDVSTGGDPILVGAYDTPGFAEGVTVDEGVAYVADGIHGGLQVIDVSNPHHPALLSWYPRPNNSFAVAKRGRFVFLADGGTGLSTFDVTNPAAPVLGDVLQTSGAVWDIVIAQSRAFLALNNGGVMAVNIADPKNLIGYPETDTMGRCLWITHANHTVYAGDTHEGVVVFDIANDCDLGCPADLNEDGILNFFDIAQFTAEFQDGSPSVDFTEDGVLNFFDVSAFLAMFQAGCP